MSHSITFGTDGWRAIIAEQFTFANVERVAYATGQYVKGHYYKGSARPPVLIGYDTRFLADKFAERAAQVLMEMGIAVRVASRDVPTPAIAWATQIEPTAGALHLTASHNPPQYCGIKYIPDYAGPATVEITNSIVSHLNDLPEHYEAKPASIETFDAKPAYFEAINKRIDWKKIQSSGLKVACDTIYSTSRGYLDTLLEDHQVPSKALHNWRDPLFGGGMPEPKPEYLRDLIKTITSEHFDLGLATDGDADRFGIIDDKGTYYLPNQILCLLARHLFKNHGLKGAIVRTVATTHLLDRLAQVYGLEAIETPVGFKYIGEIMRQKDVLIGGEESGGLSVKGHIPEKDGILAGLLVLEMMAYEKKPLAQIWQDLLNEAGMQFFAKRIDLHLTPVTQRGLIDQLKAKPFDKIGSFKVERVDRKDGLKFYIDSNTWTLVRASGTEPLVRLYFESTSEQTLDQMSAAFEKQAHDIIHSIDKQPARA
ncbi:MAG TPA: phosphoglucomutase/phosphomannomutase family protein [Candidatus Obscuribacterales bacterium]